eukprot:scaffold7863_cov118-Isochrysis_galbana.AAC.1
MWQWAIASISCSHQTSDLTVIEWALCGRPGSGSPAACRSAAVRARSPQSVRRTVAHRTPHSAAYLASTIRFGP